MTSRAFIVAVEDYPESKETSTTLPGVIANAEKFAAWLEQHMQIPRSNILFCCPGTSDFRTHGTTRADIKKAILRLIQAGAFDTTQLFVFLSGHGVMKPSQNSEPHEDFLLCSDFESSAVSGDACLNIADLTTLLTRSLGAGSHLYLVDCCRTVAVSLDPQGLGIQIMPATSGTAGAFQLHSASSGAAAANDSVFTDTVLACLDGKCDLERDAVESGLFWITFRNIARAVEQEFERLSRGVEVRTLAEKSDFRIRSIEHAGTASTILDPRGRKAPPVELLTAYDEVIFLGETNGQLPAFIEQAFTARQQRRWKRMDVLSIQDLTQAARPGVALPDLEQERKVAEDFLSSNAARLTDELALYRYNYVGAYGSLWTTANGRRRVHVSPKMLGLDIRVSPASDFIDFPNDRHPAADQYFEIAHAAMKSTETQRIFSHPS